MKTNTKLYRIKLFVLIAALLCGTIIAGCGEGKAAKANEGEDTIKIGIFEPLSGDDKEGATLEIKGIELAHKLYPTIAGKKVELIYADTKSNVSGAKLAAQKVINKEAVAVLGSYGNIISMVGGEYFEDAKIPAVAITCTNPLLTKGNPYYFRISVVDSFQAVMAAKYVYNEHKDETIVILKQEKDDYGTALAQQFTEKLQSLAEDDEREGREIKTVEYKKGSDDFSKALDKIRGMEADIIYLPSTLEDGVNIIKQARSMNMDSLFIGTNLWHEDEFVEQGGAAVEGVLITDYFDNSLPADDSSAEISSTTNDKMRVFSAAYKKHYGEEVTNGSAALGFDAYTLVAYAIEEQIKQGGRTSLRDIIAGIKEFSGVTGSISFDEDGDPIKPLALITIEGGQFKHRYTVEPEWN